MRAEFPKSIRRAALKRSGGFCEAIGPLYGLEAGQRCNAPLTHGFDFDHVILAANGGGNSLENCCCACRVCHKHKTTKHDVPLAAKTLRQQDKHLGIKKPSRWPKRKMRDGV